MDLAQLVRLRECFQFYNMIQSKQDYKKYLLEDKVALGFSHSNYKTVLKSIILPNYILKFERLLRKCEYYKNCKKGLSHLCSLPIVFLFDKVSSRSCLRSKSYFYKNNVISIGKKFTNSKFTN